MRGHVLGELVGDDQRVETLPDGGEPRRVEAPGQLEVEARSAPQADRAGDPLVEALAGLARRVQGAHVAVQRAAQSFEPLRVGAPLLLVRVSDEIERRAELLHHVSLARLVRVQLQAEGPQPDRLEAGAHHLQRRHLLGDEEHSLALPQAVRDQVGDRL